MTISRLIHLLRQCPHTAEVEVDERAITGLRVVRFRDVEGGGWEVKRVVIVPEKEGESDE